MDGTKPVGRPAILKSESEAISIPLSEGRLGSTAGAERTWLAASVTTKITRFAANSANGMRVWCEAAYENGKEDDLDVALYAHSEYPALWRGSIARSDYHCVLMLLARRGRPTLRCLTSDLGIPVPELDVDLSDLGHPILNELRRVAPTSPKGQKRILSIDNPLVYRIRVSSRRIAARHGLMRPAR